MRVWSIVCHDVRRVSINAASDVTSTVSLAAATESVTGNSSRCPISRRTSRATDLPNPGSCPWSPYSPEATQDVLPFAGRVRGTAREAAGLIFSGDGCVAHHCALGIFHRDVQFRRL